MVQIITDSAADFEPEELALHKVDCIPLSVNFGNAAYQENVNLSKRMFYNLLEQEKNIPRTSQPSPQDFMSVLERIRDAGDEAVVITLSSALSGTYQSAVLAKKPLEFDACYIVDSLTASAGERILVEQAVSLRNLGMNAQEIAKELETLRSRISLYACVDTLKYLYKGGRLSGTSYAVGSFANIKPALHVSKDGRVEIAAKLMGTRKGIRYLCDRLDSEKPDPAYPIFVMYTCNRENGELLASALRNQGCDIPESHIVNVGAAIGTHIGSNAFGLVYVSKQISCV